MPIHPVKHGSSHGPSRRKSRKILKHGKIKGKKISKKQRGLFGSIASGRRRKK